MTIIPLAAPSIGPAEMKYVVECLESGWVSSVGPFVTELDAKVAEVAGSRYGVATVNGTAALHVALMVAGVKAGDEVLVSDLTFIAPVNAVHYIGAHPVLVDCEGEYRQMDVGLVERFLTESCEPSADGLRNRQTGRRIAAIAPVHILGHPVDIVRLMALADRFGVPVVEDATESLGSTVGEQKVGSFGRLACFSFNGNKLMTTGGGGMIVTADCKLADFARYLTNQAKDDPLEYAHEHIGYNYRLTNIQAALGMAQVSRLPEFLAHKKAIAARYDQALAQIPGILRPNVRAGVDDCRWLYTISVREDEFGMDSRALLRKLEENGIQSRPLWRPIHLNTPYRNAQRLGGEVAEACYTESLSIPCSVDLSEAEQSTVINVIKELSRA